MSDQGAATTPRLTPATPASSALKPPSTEMHPSKFQQSSFAPSSALELGFSDIKDPRRRDSTHGSGIDSTPSRIGGVSASQFIFRVKPPNWTWEKTNKAQEVLAGLKGDVAKFKAQLVAAQEEESQSSATPSGERTFARPRGMTGRFSAAHIAEFKKMDSIEGHASAWRAQNGKTTPAKTLKEGASTSDSNRDASPTPHKSNSKRIPTKPPAHGAAPSNGPGGPSGPSGPSRLALKRKQSAAQIGGGQIPNKVDVTNSSSKTQPLSSRDAVPASAKRLKQNAGDDASTARPQPQDDNATPKPPSSTVRRLRSIVRPGFSQRISPTKPSTVPAKPVAAPALAPAGAGATASGSPHKQLAQSTAELSDAAAMTNATENMSLEPSIPEDHQQNASPSRLQKAKSILRGHRMGFEGQNRGLTQQATNSKDPLPSSPRPGKAPLLPLTTPLQKAAKKVTFTPDTARGPLSSRSPSPYKFGIVGKAKAMLGLESKPHGAGSVGAKANAGSGDIVYPDLSSHLNGLKDVIEPGPNEKAAEEDDEQASNKKAATPSATGTFSFRSDRTIRFGGAAASPSAFGAAPGQSSIRAVRKSIKPTATAVSTEMPGSFPTSTTITATITAAAAAAATTLSPTSNSNKENAIPSPPKVQVLTGALHGMSHKKRRRVSADSEMADIDDERAAKKRRQQGVAPVARSGAGAGAGERSSTSARNLGTTPVKKTQGQGQSDRPLGRTPGGHMTPGRVMGRTPAKVHGQSRTPGGSMTVKTMENTTTTTATTTTMVPGSTTAKKRTTFDMSRLSELARPKQR